MSDEVYPFIEPDDTEREDRRSKWRRYAKRLREIVFV